MAPIRTPIRSALAVRRVVLALTAGLLVTSGLLAGISLRPQRDDPQRWRTTSAVGFEEAARDWMASADGGSVEGLAAALASTSDPVTATRAAVLLGAVLVNGQPASELDARVRTRAGELLLQHLDERRSAGSRGALGSAVVAARALANGPRAADDAARLAALAIGPTPHPDLAVRIECASAVLPSGADGAVEFLLAVLRAETPDQAKSPRSWDRMTTMAWAKTRAAAALAGAAGLESAFRPDGSWEHQMAEADRLEAALRGPR